MANHRWNFSGLAVIALLIVILPGLLGLKNIEVPDVSGKDESRSNRYA